MKRISQLMMVICVMMFSFCFFTMAGMSMSRVHAAGVNKTIKVDGTKYVFGEKSEYVFSTADETADTNDGGTYGTFEISGVITSKTTKMGFRPMYFLNTLDYVHFCDDVNDNSGSTEVFSWLK